HDVHHTEPSAGLSLRGLGTLDALAGCRGVPKVIAGPGEVRGVGGSPTGQPTNGGQKRCVLRGHCEEFSDVVGQVERGPHAGDSGHWFLLMLVSGTGSSRPGYLLRTWASFCCFR